MRAGWYGFHYLDFSKALDKVPGLSERHGIQAELANWIHNLVDDGKQQLMVEG